MTVQLLLGRRIASQADESTQLLSFSIVIIAIISIINITIIIGSSSSNSSSSSSGVVLVVEIVNRAILLVPVKFVVEYHALFSIVFFCLPVVFFALFFSICFTVQVKSLSKKQYYCYFYISLQVERNEDHDDRRDQNDQNTTLTAFTVYTLKENAFHVHGFIGLC